MWAVRVCSQAAVKLLRGQVYPVPELLFPPDDDLGDDLNIVLLNEGLGNITGAVSDNFDFLWFHTKNF